MGRAKLTGGVDVGFPTGIVELRGVVAVRSFVRWRCFFCSLVEKLLRKHAESVSLLIITDHNLISL